MLRVLSLFSGIGAFEKALTRLGIPFELVGYSEIDKYASKAYSLIHNESENKNLGDITKVNAKQLPDFNLMTWGFPCTDISAAGEQAGIVLKCTDCEHIFDITQTEDYLCPYCNSEHLDSITESGLYYYGWKILKYKQPEYSLIENVKNLTQKKFKTAYNKILKDLDKLEYNTYTKVLNAKDYGIPQNRERVYIICIRKDIDNGTFNFPKPIPLKKTLTEILEPDAKLPILHNVYGGFKEKKPRVFTEYSPTIRTAKGGGHIPSVYILEDFYKNRLAREYDEYAPTIRSGRKGLKVINEKMTRYLTTLEALRLMDFDDSDYYILRENGFSDTVIYRLAGNSIVVSVLEEIYKILFKKYIN